MSDVATPEEKAQPIVPEGVEGFQAYSVQSLTGLVGWNSVAVFRPGEVEDGNTVRKTKKTVAVVLADPCPEYKQIVFVDGEFHHEGTLLTIEYEGVFEDLIEMHGHAEVVPLSEVPCIERDEYNIPTYTCDGVGQNGGESNDS